MPTINNLSGANTIYRAEKIAITFTIYGASSTSTPLDISGWTTAFAVKTAAESTETLITKAGSLVTPTSGILSVTLNSTDTNSLPPAEYAHDLWRTDVGSEGLLSIGTLLIANSPQHP